MAEGVGFEPTLRFPVNTLSKRAPSATRPPLQNHKGPEAGDRGALYKTKCLNQLACEDVFVAFSKS